MMSLFFFFFLNAWLWKEDIKIPILGFYIFEKTHHMSVKPVLKHYLVPHMNSTTQKSQELNDAQFTQISGLSIFGGI